MEVSLLTKRGYRINGLTEVVPNYVITNTGTHYELDSKR